MYRENERLNVRFGFYKIFMERKKHVSFFSIPFNTDMFLINMIYLYIFMSDFIFKFNYSYNYRPNFAIKTDIFLNFCNI